MKETTYKCPVCKGNLHACFGESIHPNNPEFGVTVFCASKLCPAQEVMGHSNNEKNAFEIVTDRFKSLV